MNAGALFDGLLDYVLLIIVITFHEFGHAWASWRLGDDTARLQGRVTLNPVAHMELIGTVVLPLLAILLRSSALASFIIGWGRPVPVNPMQLRRGKFDEMLVAMAGPMMNVLIALLAMAVIRAAILLHQDVIIEPCARLAKLSMFLCFFNLLPIPPLDGSHVLKFLTGMSYEVFWRFSQFGILIVLVVFQMPPVQLFLRDSTMKSLWLMAWLFAVR
ncbi:MAG TPA: site-2 protease family protein [Verrucomicrobiae bacterium]|nr:site-2 protease family protein [Verrucomicrobiae bacterium]